MIQIISGHSNHESGAVSGINKEFELTQLLRNQIVEILDKHYHRKVTIDNDDDNLKMVIKRVKQNRPDFLLSLHFNAYNTKARGTEVVIRDATNVALNTKATDLLNIVTKCLGTKSRGVKLETQTAHKRLGILHSCDNALLLEVCFLDNKNDMKKLDMGFNSLSIAIAQFIADLHFNIN